MFILAGLNTNDDFQASAFEGNTLLSFAAFADAGSMADWISAYAPDRVSLMSTAYAKIDALRRALADRGIVCAPAAK